MSKNLKIPKLDYSKKIQKEIYQRQEYNDLKSLLMVQKEMMEQYQTWIQILLSVINNRESTTNHIDIGTPIQEGLKGVEKIKNDNFEIKKKIIEVRKKNLSLIEQYKNIKWKKQNIISDYTTSSSNEINIENEQLKDNIQYLANEIDYLSEIKDKLNDNINNDPDIIRYKNLYDEIKELKKTNEIAKEIKNNKLYFNNQRK
jgi:hypothetical protein